MASSISGHSQDQIPQLPTQQYSYPNTTHLIRVVYLDNAQKFFVQLVAAEMELKRLMKAISIYSRSEIMPLLTNAISGTPCLALRPGYQSTYYRAMVTAINKNLCTVKFVDYGWSAQIFFHELRALPNCFLSLRAQAICCSLRSSDTNSDACLRQFAGRSTLYCQVLDCVGDTFIIQLARYLSEVAPRSWCLEVTPYFSRSGGTPPNAPGQEITEYQAEVQQDLPSRKVDYVTEAKVSCFLPPYIPLGGAHDAYMTEVTSPDDFFIQLASVEHTLLTLALEFSPESEETLGQVLTNPTVGCACLAKYTEDNYWYRATVIVLRETTVDVLFVDYGNVDNVSREFLHVLSPRFLEIPPFAIKCKLNGTRPPGDKHHWLNSATQHFRETTKDTCLSVQFINQDVPASINISKEAEDLAQAMVNLKLACKEKANLNAVKDHEGETLSPTQVTTVDVGTQADTVDEGDLDALDKIDTIGDLSRYLNRSCGRL